MITPATSTAPLQRDVRDAEFLAPRGEAHRDAAVRDLHVRSGVPSLHGVRGPAAVAGLVVSVIVDAVEGEDRPTVPTAFRAWAHVGQEVLEAVAPPIADADAPPSVVFEARLIGIGTAIDDPAPCSVLRSAATSMSCLRLAGSFPMEAAAALARARAQIRRGDRPLISTIAAAEPCGMTGVTTTTFNDNPSTEALAHEISQSRHAGIVPEIVVDGKEKV